jgi:hypothetical protein
LVTSSSVVSDDVIGDGAEAKAFAYLQADDVTNQSFVCPFPWLVGVVDLVPFFVPTCAYFFALSPWLSWSWQMLCCPFVLVADDGLLVMADLCRHVVLVAEGGRWLGQVLCHRGFILMDDWLSYFCSRRGFSTVIVAVIAGGCFATIVCFMDALSLSSLIGGCFAIVVVLLRGCLTSDCDCSPSTSVVVVCFFL